MTPPLTRLHGFKNVCHQWLYIEDDGYIDVLFGVAFANRYTLKSKPVWLYLIGPVGCGKTEVVQSWSRNPGVYMASTLTAHTLVSGCIVEPGQPDPSLLPKLNNKILVIKDFTAILTMNHEALMTIAGQLRDSYDGELAANFGTGKSVPYKAKYGIIAAVTDAIDNHLRVLSPLGERFLSYRLPELSDEEITKRCQLSAECRSYVEQEEALRQAANKVLIMDPPVPEMDESWTKLMAAAAEQVAVLRTTVARDRRGEISNYPSPEVPTRLSKQMTCLAKGIAMAREKAEVTEGEVKLAMQCGFGAISRSRMTLLRYLLSQYPYGVNIAKMIQDMKLPQSTIRRWVEDLYVLKVLDRTKPDTKATTPWDWVLTSRYGDFLTKYL